MNDADPLVSGVDDVLITAELASRPSRSPDYQNESRALGLLAEEMVTNPRGVLQKCAELVMELCHADSAGISILEPGGTSGILRWRAAAGAFAANLNGTMPREASPCGTVMERNRVLLFNEAERFFPALRGVEPRIYENLLSPWHAAGKAAGTLWAIKHTPEGRFDAEDARVLQSLARFAAAAFQMISALEKATAERAALSGSEERLRNVLDGMDEAFGLMDRDLRIILQNKAALALDGRSLEEIQGRLHSEVYPDADPELIALFERALAEDKPVSLEHRYGWEEGRASWLEMRAFPVPEGLAVFWRDISDRKEAEQTLRESEVKFRTLFESIEEGLAIVEMIYDDQGEITDMIFRQVNPAYERQTGIGDAVDRSIYDIIPGVEGYWIELFKKVATTGEPARLESYQQDVDMWFDVRFTRVDAEARFVAIVFNNTTERKRAEATLRENAERQAFLLKFSDTLRTEPDADAIALRALEMLSSHMQLDRCYIGEWRLEEDRGDLPYQVGNDRVPPVPDHIRLSDFPEAMRIALDQTLVINDVRKSEFLADADKRNMQAMGLIGLVASAARKGEGVPSFTTVAVSAQPRDWTPGEIALIEEANERIWAAIERARADAALRASEDRFRLIVENARDYGIFTTTPDGLIDQWYQGAAQVFGWSAEEAVGQLMDITFTPEDRASGEPAKEREGAARDGWVPNVRWHLRKDGGRVFIEGIASALRDASGTLTGFLKIGQDVTARHAAEERQKLLLAELQHRVRNILAMIRSVVRQSKEGYADIEEFVAHLVGRLDAMARTQVVLTRAAGAKVDLESMVWDELEAQGAEQPRVKVSGPEIRLSPKAAEVLSLALHELATNSIKYGALFEPHGRLSVTRGVALVDGEDWLQLVWEERCKQVQPRPIKEGFGTELIQDRIPYELRGEATLHITDGGVRAEIAFPLTKGTSILETGPAQGSTQ